MTAKNFNKHPPSPGHPAPMAGQKTRYPIPESEKPEPEPEKSEPEKPEL